MNTDLPNHDSQAFVRTAVERHQAPLRRYAARILLGDTDRGAESSRARRPWAGHKKARRVESRRAGGG